MAFEGRCGSSVDELPEAFKNLTDDECFDLEERYENEPIFRREIGPNIPLWAKLEKSIALIICKLILILVTLVSI